MGLFDQIREPVFLRQSDRAEKQIEMLKVLRPSLNEEGQLMLEKDIRCLEYGIQGENNIIFELKNSHMPMYILQDICLEAGDLKAQIDFLVFTRKICFVIECKNLYGDIEITKSGDFIRSMTFGTKKVKEGIYSPITQNERHLQLMKKIKQDSKSNVLLRALVGQGFENFNKSIVVLANPKTIVSTQYASKEIKEKVIRADQVVSYIKKACNESKVPESSDKDLLKWAQSYLELHKEPQQNYCTKYADYQIDQQVEGTLEKSNYQEIQDIEKTEVYLALKEYRLNKSKEEKIKPYYIYNNNELKALISIMPNNKEELQKIQGFGIVKTAKYGEEIISILNKHR